MRHGDLYTNAARLKKSTEELQVAWHETNELWQDDVSRNFSQRYLEPLGPTVKVAIDATMRMQQLLKQILRECEG